MCARAAIALRGFPNPFSWRNAPQAFVRTSDDSFTLVAGAKTDLFTDPRGAVVVDNAPQLLFRPATADADNFVLSARVSVDFAATYDAGALLIYNDPRNWAKLCLEYAPPPQQQPTIVSVITKTFSDDCNSSAVAGNSVYLRVARLGNACAMHYSTDAVAGHWHLVRYFALGKLDKLRVGFAAQSPTGQQCSVVFDEIRFESRTLADIRSGE
jgi:hypothetical protein